MEAWHIIAGLVVSVVSAVIAGGGGAWLLKWYQQKRGHQVEDRTDVWARQALLIDRLDRQLVIVQADLRRSQDREAICEQKIVRIQAYGQWLYSLLQQDHEALVSLGAKVGKLPEFTDFSIAEPISRAEKEFTARATQHVSGLLHEEAREIGDGDESTRGTSE